jgi:hypothetical protein
MQRWENIGIKENGKWKNREIEKQKNREAENQGSRKSGSV